METNAVRHAHVCVWIDSEEARIFGIGPEGFEEQVIDATPHLHLHRKVGDGHQHHAADAFLRSVADALADARGILVVGPGPARSELVSFLNAHFPDVAGRLWGVHPMDHPTDRQIVAAARKFFHGADQMRS